MHGGRVNWCSHYTNRRRGYIIYKSIKYSRETVRRLRTTESVFFSHFSNPPSRARITRDLRVAVRINFVPTRINIILLIIINNYKLYIHIYNIYVVKNESSSAFLPSRINLYKSFVLFFFFRTVRI